MNNLIDRASNSDRVLIVSYFPSTGIGAYPVSEGLANRLKSQGWIVLCTSLHKARFRRLADMVFTVVLCRDEYDMALVDVYSGMAFVWAEVVTHLLNSLRKPFILTLRGGNLPGFARRHPNRVRRVLSMASVVTAPSRYLQVKMKTYRTDITLLPNPVDQKRYPYRERSSPKPSLAWLRAFHGIYNTPLAAHVISLLVTKFPNIHMTMYGPDKGDGSLLDFQSVLVDLNLERQITVDGPIPKHDVARRLSRHDIFLNTTNVDNTPVSVIEAMALGMCIVSTDVGGLPYLLEDGHSALLVPPRDPEAMAGAVQRILTEPGLAVRLSTNARKTVEAWDWDLILSKWKDLLREVAEGSHC